MVGKGQVLSGRTVGWIGVGRMGAAMARRLAESGATIKAYNRSIEKIEPLKQYGVEPVRRCCELAKCDVVFAMLSTGDVLNQVLLGEDGLLSGPARPKIVVDCSSISIDASRRLREALSKMGIEFLAAPISGNPHVVEDGKATFVVSGSHAVFDEVKEYLLAMAGGATFVGEGELARVAKICHNVCLGVLTQSLAEAIVLAEKAGMPRKAFLDFLNSSALGSTYTRAKTPYWVALDFTPTCTPAVLRKDMDLGLFLAREFGATMPLSAATREMIQALINGGFEDADFSALLIAQAKASGVNLQSVAEAGRGSPPIS